ncbi:hypothetical protein GGQ94_003310 [Petrimonas sulfuriphila]|jgi:hypothetical protein
MFCTKVVLFRLYTNIFNYLFDFYLFIIEKNVYLQDQEIDVWRSSLHFREIQS